MLGLKLNHVSKRGHWSVVTVTLALPLNGNSGDVLHRRVDLFDELRMEQCCYDYTMCPLGYTSNLIVGMADVSNSLVYVRHNSPGVALIIVNENFEPSGCRCGADKDFQILTDTFRRLGFTIVALYDVTDKEILAVIRTGK